VFEMQDLGRGSCHLGNNKKCVGFAIELIAIELGLGGIRNSVDLTVQKASFVMIVAYALPPPPPSQSPSPLSPVACPARGSKPASRREPASPEIASSAV